MILHAAAPDPPLHIVWSPANQVGHPTIAGTRIRPEDIAGRIWAGESVAEVAEDFGLTIDQVRLACWFIARWPYPVKGRRRRHRRPAWQVAASRHWSDWADGWLERRFWRKHGPRPVDPPMPERKAS